MQRIIISTFSCFLWLCTAMVMTPHAAHAQDMSRPLGIIAVVNDTVLTSDDLDQRLRLALAFSRLEDTAEVRRRLVPQLLQKLIDESLQYNEATSRRLSVSEVEVNSAVKRMQEQFKLTPESMRALLKQNGIRPETLRTQLRSEIAWSKLLFQRMKPRIVINEAEIDEAIEAISGGEGVEEYHISDILLPVDSPDNESNAQKLAENLVEEIREGASIERLAVQFPTIRDQSGMAAARWVGTHQMDDMVITQLQRMKIGEVSAPIRTAGGYHIVKLEDKRNLLNASHDQSEVALMQIVMPVEEDISAENINTRMSEAERLGYSIAGCKDFKDKTTRIEGAKFQDLGRLQIKQLHEEVRKVVRNLAVGTVSTPFRTPLGIHLMIVCERINANSTIINREQIRERLSEKKLMLEALRTMHNLRREAFVDVRI